MLGGDEYGFWGRGIVCLFKSFTRAALKIYNSPTFVYNLDIVFRVVRANEIEKEPSVFIDCRTYVCVGS